MLITENSIETKSSPNSFRSCHATEGYRPRTDCARDGHRDRIRIVSHVLPRFQETEMMNIRRAWRISLHAVVGFQKSIRGQPIQLSGEQCVPKRNTVVIGHCERGCHLRSGIWPTDSSELKKMDGSRFSLDFFGGNVRSTCWMTRVSFYEARFEGEWLAGRKTRGRERPEPREELL